MKGLWKIIVLVIAIFVVGNSIFVLDETEQAIITMFGDPIGGAHTQAGLHWKIPILHEVHRFEKRLLEWDGEPKQIPTSDKKYIWIDTFARWKIVDPLLFFQSMRNETYAHSRLDDILSGTTRDIVSLNLLLEIIRNSNRELEYTEDFDESLDEILAADIMKGRNAIADSIFVNSKPAVSKYGIELVDLEIKRINYIQDVRKKVYERMISERHKIAAKYRSAGQGKAAEILGKLRKDLDQIQSEAYKTAQEIKGKADAEATALYANAYKKDAQFFELTRTLESYKKSMGKKNSLIMSTDSDYYKFLKKSK